MEVDPLLVTAEPTEPSDLPLKPRLRVGIRRETRQSRSNSPALKKRIVEIDDDRITNTSFLTSDQINAAQTILKKQFPEIGGLFCPTLGASLDYPAVDSTKWLQILHDGDEHWYKLN